MSLIEVPVSYGELLDKISILEIKSEHIKDADKLVNVHRELNALNDSWHRAVASKKDIQDLLKQLKAVNERLWAIEDDIRLKEARAEFDADFIQLARSVYFENDERARLKREINMKLGSALVEEKSYKNYQSKSSSA